MKPPIPWYGGKAKLAPELLPYIPEHDCYVEPYGGAGALLFAKEPSRVEIYNDLHKDVVNLYRMLRDYPDQFIEKVKLTPYSRENLEIAWKRLQYWKHPRPTNVPGDVCLTVELARCFFVIARQTFSARHDQFRPGMKNPGSLWSSSKKSNHALAWMNAIERLPEIHERLSKVQIECRPAIEVIKQYDGEDTFMYLDPPYIEESRKELNTYNYEMTDNDHLELIATIKRREGMVLISGYHNELYDNLLGSWHYKDFEVNISPISTNHSNASKKRTEVIWWNDTLAAMRVGEQLELEVH